MMQRREFPDDAILARFIAAGARVKGGGGIIRSLVQA
jgi:hypothetical protein